jgi:hypothetical protein
LDPDLFGELSSEGDLLSAEAQDDRAEGEPGVTEDTAAGGDAETEQLRAQGFIGNVGNDCGLAAT